MSRTLFISDLHLDPSRPAVTRALADFLAANTDGKALYILGDLFEAWPGDDDDSPLAREVIALYDKGLEYCRTKEELKEMQSMRVLTQAQVDAATALKMDTFSMQ